MQLAAAVAALFLIVLVVFQLALALGAPAGAAAWGGTYPGVLPFRLRIASAVAGLVVYPVLILVILQAGNVVDVGWNVSGMWMWFLTGFFAIGTLLNFASRSKPERIWGPVSLVIAICCGVVAFGV